MKDAKWIVGQITCLIAFLSLLAVAIWHKQLHITHGATVAVVIGVVVGALGLLLDWESIK